MTPAIQANERPNWFGREKTNQGFVRFNVCGDAGRTKNTRYCLVGMTDAVKRRDG